jgi:hypothetical protein
MPNRPFVSPQSHFKCFSGASHALLLGDDKNQAIAILSPSPTEEVMQIAHSFEKCGFFQLARFRTQVGYSKERAVVWNVGWFIRPDDGILGSRQLRSQQVPDDT